MSVARAACVTQAGLIAGQQRVAVSRPFISGKNVVSKKAVRIQRKDVLRSKRQRSVVVRASDPSADSELSELEAVAAAVERLKLENEALKANLQADVQAPSGGAEAPTDAAVAMAVAVTVAEEDDDDLKVGVPCDNPFKENWKDFTYPPVKGDGTGIYKEDPGYAAFADHLSYRWNRYVEKRTAIDQYEGGLEKFSRGYEYMGFTRSINGITYREWAPAATEAYLIGDFNAWDKSSHKMAKNGFGVFEIDLPNSADGTPAIEHGSRVKIHMKTEDGKFIDRIPLYIKMAVQAPGEIPFNGIYYDPPKEEQYKFKYPRPKKPRSLRIYECHVGMSSPEEKVSTYLEFARDVIPRAAKMGYNAIQLMAIQEHAFYGSFGYHVTNFFAVSSRSGTPDELKYLMDTAHAYGLVVLMDIVHSHASSNSIDGINEFDGSDGHFFHSGPQGYHWMWDSRCFNYGQYETMRFLLSNLRWWMEEYKFDGFRFDGVTSMMYTHHGLQYEFTGGYGEYFGMNTDVECMTYLMLANDMLHTLYPDCITIGEDVSGMPTLGRPVIDGGIGFDYRLQMGIADKWVEVMEEWVDDYGWDLGNLVFCMENRRYNEKCISYAESHDQALVGSKSLAFWLMDADMYDSMSTLWPTTDRVNRGIAIHKMIRLFTMGLGGEGYLTFMGNEFGHPEWIDFPRDDRICNQGKFIPGNGNSYALARRRYDLADQEHLRYKHLNEFERHMNWMEEKYQTMVSSHQYVSRKDEDSKMIVFERGDALYVFNFHPVTAYSDFRVGCKQAGKYKIVLNSDREEFGGWNNVNEKAEFFANEQQHDGRPASFQVYAPPRTCVVYAPTDEYPDPLDAYCEAEPSADECRVYDD